MEVWRPVPGFKFYEASSLGRVRSIDRMVRGRYPGFLRKMRGCVLKPFDNGKYLTVSVSDETHCVHELVALAFHGPSPTPGFVVRHLNGNSRLNSAENLKWGSVKQNQEDRFAHGTACEGSKNYRAVLTEEKVLRIMGLRGTLGPAAIARAVGCERHLVKHVVYGQSWNWLTQLPRERSSHRRT